MKSIIEALYGGGGKPVSPTANRGGSDYYGSFQYWQDKANDVGPPPASQGGPTAQEIMQHENMVNNQGMLSANPNVSPIVAALYGGGPSKIGPSNNSMNPNYQAGAVGDTVGGIGNTDGWGRDIGWSRPQGGIGQEGTVFETPAGNYQVSKNPWGQYVLVPQDGAPGGVGPYLTNLTQGQHHVGINPETGEVWYQEAAGYTNFSGSGNDYYENPNAPPGANPNNPNNDGGSNNGSNNASGQGSTWQEVLNRGGKDIDSWDKYLGLFTGIENGIDWTSMSQEQINTKFDELFNMGLFGDVANAELIYARLLENLGLA